MSQVSFFSLSHSLYSTASGFIPFVSFGCGSQRALPSAVKVYEQTLSVSWKAKASLQPAHPTVPLSRVLSLLLNWNPRRCANTAGCQAGSGGPVCIDSSWFPVSCQLGIPWQALIPHYLNCKFHEHIIMLLVHPGLKLIITDQCLRGASLNFNNTIKFPE